MAKQAKRQLAGSGEALPAGAVGEVKYSFASRGFLNNTNSNIGYSLNANLLGDRTLTPGLWLVYYTAAINVTAGVTQDDRAAVLTTDSVDGWGPASNLSANPGGSNLVFPRVATNGSDMRSGVALVRVTSSGIVNGTGFNLYLKMYAATHSSFTGNYECNIIAIRIA
jgi:hypothetical protein